VAVDRDGDVENRAIAGVTTNVRAAVPHNALDGRESFTPFTGWRARPHVPQLHRQLLAFGLRKADRDTVDTVGSGSRPELSRL